MTGSNDDQHQPSDTPQGETTIGAAVVKHSLILTTFAVIVALSVALVDRNTRDEIQYQRQAAERRALTQVMPAHLHDNDLLSDTLTLSAEAGFENPELLGTRGDAHAWIARLNGDISGIILPAIAPDGYSGNIELLVGIRADGSLSGVRVVSHRETPGLGDRIDLRIDDWILGFEGKSLNDPPRERWRVRKDGGDFDQFTGATITPRAVVAAVRRSLTFFQQNRARLLAQ